MATATMTMMNGRRQPVSHCPWRHWRASQCPWQWRLASQSPGGGGEGLTMMMTMIDPPDRFVASSLAAAWAAAT